MLGDDREQTRFGFGLDEAVAVGAAIARADAGSKLAITGVHFHLNGYDGGDRVSAIGEALALVDALRLLGHEPGFIDIGGGNPDQPPRQRAAVGALLERAPRGAAGAARAADVRGPRPRPARPRRRAPRPARPSYPFWQRPIHGGWFDEVLAGRVTAAGRQTTVAEGLRERGLQLRCEPGRALLDGCGMTAARVSHRKQRRDGTWLIGLEMNRTQCRSTSEDFLVDPLLLRPEGEVNDPGDAPTDAIEGYLVGAYCIERELLTWRRLRFPRGVAVGDVVVFPNTAGYLMHILESSSHQIPLARNLVGGTRTAARRSIRSTPCSHRAASRRRGVPPVRGNRKGPAVPGPFRSRPVSRILSLSSHPSERPTWTSAGSLQAVLLGLASGGVCLAAVSPRRRCALTAPFHPCLCAVGGTRSDAPSAVCFCGTFPRVSPGRVPDHPAL